MTTGDAPPSFDRVRLACIVAEANGEWRTAWRLTGKFQFRRSIVGTVVLWVEEERRVRAEHPSAIRWSPDNWEPQTRMRRARIYELGGNLDLGGQRLGSTGASP